MISRFTEQFVHFTLFLLARKLPVPKLRYQDKRTGLFVVVVDDPCTLLQRDGGPRNWYYPDYSG